MLLQWDTSEITSFLWSMHTARTEALYAQRISSVLCRGQAVLPDNQAEWDAYIDVKIKCGEWRF